MKRAYVRPTMVGERFVANEYVAACGDKGTVYKFKCDAGGGKSGDVYLETNGRKGFQPLGDTYLSGYHACGTTHDANTADVFLDGYYVRGLTVTRLKYGVEKMVRILIVQQTFIWKIGRKQSHKKQIYIHIEKEPDFRFFFKIYRNC